MSLDDESPTQNWTRNEADNAPYVAPTFRRSATADVKEIIGDSWPVAAVEHAALAEEPLTRWERLPRFWQFITVYVAGGLTSSAGWFLGSWLLP